MFNLSIIIAIVAIIILIILGFTVYSNDPKSKVSYYFVLIVISGNLWIITSLLTIQQYGLSLNINQLANSLTYFFAYTAIVAGMLFTYVYPYRKSVSQTEKLIMCTIVSLTLVLSLTPLVSGYVTINNAGLLSFKNGQYIGLYAFSFLILIGISIRNLIISTLIDHGKYKHQSITIIIGFGVSAIAGLLLNVIIPVFVHDWSLVAYGPIVAVLFTVSITYAIVKQKMFNIRLTVIRTLIYGAALLSFSLLYYLVTYVLSVFIFSGDVSTKLSVSPYNILIGLVLALTFAPMKNFFDRATTRIFYKDGYDSDEFIERLNQILASSTSLHALMIHTANEISNTLKSEQVWIAVGGQDLPLLNVGTAKSSKITIQEYERISSYVLGQKQQTTIVSSSDDCPIDSILLAHRISLLLPLLHNHRVIGFVMIGNRRTGTYTKNDIKTIKALSGGILIALQNARLVQEVNDINAGLEKRINEATAHLRETNKELHRIDATKDEFISMASHQLRTPLTSVKGYVSMVLEGDAGKVSTDQRELLSEAFESSERMVHLINDFLNVSRIQTGKFILDTHPADLSQIVQKEIHSLKTTAEAHDLKLVYRRPTYFPLVPIDENKIRQVIMNFIDNAIYYSHKNSIIHVEVETGDGDIVFKVIDTGIGVPKEQQRHLFTKFFRANNAKRQRPDGTGVGIFLAKKVVSEHGGSIVFESVENQGSIFGFRLPIHQKTIGHTIDKSQPKQGGS